MEILLILWLIYNLISFFVFPIGGGIITSLFGNTNLTYNQRYSILTTKWRKLNHFNFFFGWLLGIGKVNALILSNQTDADALIRYNFFCILTFIFYLYIIGCCKDRVSKDDLWPYVEKKFNKKIQKHTFQHDDIENIKDNQNDR